MSTLNSNGIIVPQILQGTTATDQPIPSAEQLTSSGWTATGWTGSFAAGYTHTVGNTTALANSGAAVSGTTYKISYTITGRTAGTVTISFGAVNSAAVSVTGAYYPKATSTASLTVTPTTDFDGTITLSRVSLSASTPIITGLDGTGSIRYEIRYSFAVGNLGIGIGALGFNAIGTNNTAIGSQALLSATTATSNSAFGLLSLSSLTSGANNTATGRQSLGGLLTGGNNVSSGYQAGYFIADGITLNTATNNCGYWGASTKALTATDLNSDVIGYNITGYGSNTTIIGNTSKTHTIVAGKFAIRGSGNGSFAAIANITAQLHIPAGTAAAGTASVKIDSGVLLTAPEANALENDGTNLYFTSAADTTRRRIRCSDSVTLPSTITTGASPYTYQNTDAYPREILIRGGTVSLIEFTRDNSTFYTYATSSAQPVAVTLMPGDRVKVTYSSTPIMIKIPQ